MDALQLIAEPKRREIIRLIWDDERSAGQIAENFSVTFGAVSQHLALLREAGLIDVRREGNSRIYSANRDALAPFSEILERAWAGTLERLATTIEQHEPR